VSVSPQQVSFTPFINGDTDVCTATLYTDVAVLRGRMGQDSLRLFTPEDYGITIPRDTVIVSEKTASDSPKLVEAFLRASIRGWQEAKRNPDAAVAAVMKVAPTLNKAQEEGTLVEILRLMGAGAAQTQGIFTIDKGVVTRAGDFLLRYGALTQPVDIDAGFKPQALGLIRSAERML
jgi:NitT/TauT family transport system substrate-binding protein